MRDLINLFEAPYQIDQDDYTDSSLLDQTMLGHPTEPKNFNAPASQLLRTDHEVLERNSRYLLARARYDDAGEYFLISQPGHRVTYHNSYEVDVIPGLGRSATQKTVEARNPNYRGIARRVLLTYMLADVDAVVADNDQTPNGRDFWIKTMVEAINTGHAVGIYNERTHALNPYEDRAGAFDDWLGDNWPWGRTHAHHDLRPYISRHHG